MNLREKILFEPPEIGCVLSLTGLPGGGSKIYDRSPYGNIGTIVGATWVRLPSGLWCLSFDGNDDYVNCGNNESLAIADAITIEAWVYAETLGQGSAGRIVAKNDIVNYAYLPIVANNSIAIYFDSAQYPSDASVFVLNIFQHFAVTFDKNLGSNQIKHYKNGNPIGTNTRTAAIPTSANSLVVGNRSAGGRTWDGYVSLLRFYNRALSALEIQNHFCREKHLFGVW